MHEAPEEDEKAAPDVTVTETEQTEIVAAEEDISEIEEDIDDLAMEDLDLSELDGLEEDLNLDI